MSLLKVLSYECNLAHDSYFYSGIFDTEELSYDLIQTGSTAYGSSDAYKSPYSTQWSIEDVHLFETKMLPTLVERLLEAQTFLSRNIDSLAKVGKGEHLVLQKKVSPRKIWSSKVNFVLPEKVKFAEGTEVIFVDWDDRFDRAAVEYDGVRFYVNSIYDLKYSPKTKPDILSSGNLLADFKKFSRYDRWYMRAIA
jgi:hypothetical protein